MVDYSEMIKNIREIDVSKWIEESIDEETTLMSSDVAIRNGFHIALEPEKFMFESMFVVGRFIFDADKLKILELKNHDNLVENEPLSVTDFEIKLMNMVTSPNIVKLRLMFCALYALLMKYKEYEFRYDIEEKASARLTPKVKNKSKAKCFGLYKYIHNMNEYYFVRSQFYSLNRAEKELNGAGYALVRRWNNVSHAIDIGNKFKERLKELRWSVSFYYSTMTNKGGYTDAQFIEELEKIIIVNVNEELNLSGLKI